ncbi:unnamed protein product [Chilo suppressalis]|uniref:Peptidase S1 domain-containing protein n=1 Tax=Chilo suppressalis TaxID=168631 RepID=A0ABN8BF32_CHISP|nr:unnamed protein product [Chilo suppressalis]
MRVTVNLIILYVAVAAAANNQARIPIPAGIHPQVAALLRAGNLQRYTQTCAGTILNNRSVLTAARCVSDGRDVDEPNLWRFRVGSSRWDIGGDVYLVRNIIINDFDQWSMMNDVAVLRSAGTIVFGPNVQPGQFAGSDYFLQNNQAISTVGWGYLGFPLWYPKNYSELQRVQLWTIDVNICRQSYFAEGFYVQNSMICSGFINPNAVAGASVRDRCFGEPGAPMFHSNVVVGIRSYGLSCMSNAAIPSINTRVSSHIDWIISNA